MILSHIKFGRVHTRKYIRNFDMDASASSLLMRWIKKEARDFFLEYETPKVVKIYSLKLGLFNRGLQLIVLGYIIGYIFIYNKGYQATQNGESNTVAKVKGMIKTNISQGNGSYKVWDAADLVIPAVENNAVFIATNVIQTPNQATGQCPEDIHLKSARCLADSQCPAGEALVLGNGFRTGKCSTETNTCEIDGWCPAEQDKAPDPPLFEAVANFTILVKNYVVFPKGDIKRRNIRDNATSQDLGSCRYHNVTNRECPIFDVKYIVELAGANFTEIARSGGIIAFIIKWDCNLDRDLGLCFPEYEFRRMDNKEEKIAKGWSFRSADYWNDPFDGRRKRSLYKYYGIRFVFMVHSKAGQFDTETLALNVGSAVGLLGLTTIVCDFVTLFILRKQMQVLREKKIDRIRVRPHIKPPQKKEILGQIIDTPKPILPDPESSFDDLEDLEELEKLTSNHQKRVLETNL